MIGNLNLDIIKSEEERKKQLMHERNKTRIF